MRVRAFVLLAALSFAAVASPAKTEFRLDLEYKKTYTFAEATGGYNLQSMYGSYSEPMAFTGGHSLNIYPNGKFTVIDWCDICPPTLLARGTYTFADGAFEFSYDERRDGSNTGNSPAKLLAFHGWVEEKPGVTSGSAYILIRPDQVENARKDRNFLDLLRLNTWYPDWQAMYEKDISLGAPQARSTNN